MRIRLTHKSVAPIVLILTAAVLIILQYLATGVSGEGDSIAHYQIARYAPLHHELFLSHWGKPLFTLLSAPFAQFGYSGGIAFNLICGLLSGWIACLTAKKLGYPHSWVAILFTVFTPLYLFVMYSCLTEILFSLVLITAIYLFADKRFIISAIVISLIPFARTEGIMFIALFMVALIWMKQYKALPFLLTGFVLFGLAGIPVYHDFLWFINKMPYSTGSAALYGSGSFWFYFGRMSYNINYPLLILGITGLLFLLLNLKKEFKNFSDIKVVALYGLIVPGFFGFILAHSFLWWRGLGILASDRFMACVLPLGAILALTGFEWVIKKAKVSRILYWMTGVFIITLVVYKPFTYHLLPSKTERSYGVMQELTSWLKASPYKNRYPVYSSAFFPFYMDMDPFDRKPGTQIMSYEKTDPASLLKSGEVLIWDSQFAGYEGKLPFDSVVNNNQFRLLKVFKPAENFKIFGEDYKMAVFLKAPRDTTTSAYRQLHLNNFENNLLSDSTVQVSTDFHKSGKKSICLTPQHIYSSAAEGKLIDLPDSGTVSLRASVNILNSDTTENGKAILVLSIDQSDHKILKYYAVSDEKVTHKPSEWYSLNLTESVDRNIPEGGWYKVYVWYTGNGKIYVDDLKLEFLPVGY